MEVIANTDVTVLSDLLYSFKNKFEEIQYCITSKNIRSQTKK